ncbi:CPK2 [Symbiodinium pilosum]|uniref:CPK2 protein n=1 Tax=Symbiodinium pilosum TaxID=2952 RepID=A0A812KPR4_SYMPI|nr:CPK2 [Symbiodinium pilosum]
MVQKSWKGHQKQNHSARAKKHRDAASSAASFAPARLEGTPSIRQQQASRYLEAACKTANFVERSRLINDLAASNIADDVEGLSAAKEQLQVVQKRLQVREACNFEGFAARRLQAASRLAAHDERRWPVLDAAVEAGEAATERLREAQLTRAKKIASLTRKVLNQWQYGMIDRLQEVVDAQDLELLDTLRPWIERAQLQDHEEGAELVQRIDKLGSATEALQSALDIGTGAAFREALWKSEEAALNPARCDMLQRVDSAYGPIRGRNLGRWAIVASRTSGDKECLQAALVVAERCGLDTDTVSQSLETAKSARDMLSQIAQLTVASRQEDVSKLEAAIQSTKNPQQEAKLGRRASLDKLLAEVRMEALQTLFDTKQKAKVQEEIKATAAKRSTQVLQELPKKIQDAEKLRMSGDAKEATRLYKKALLEKEIRGAMVLSDGHALRAAVSKANASAFADSLDEQLLESARAALREMTLLDQAREIVKGSNTMTELDGAFDKLVQENFPEGVRPQSTLGRAQAQIKLVRQKVAELDDLIQSPISFENSSSLLQESGMRQLRLVLDILRPHPYIAMTIEQSASHMAGERSKTVQDLLRKSCRNQLISKQTKEKNKQVKLCCDVETCNSEIKATLLKMLQKCLGWDGAVTYVSACWPFAWRPSWLQPRRDIGNVVRERLAAGHALYNGKHGSNVDIKSLFFAPDPNRCMMKSYTNLRKLGSGAFGSVYKAQCRLTAEWRAIKKLPLTDVEDDMAFVYAELEAMIHLHHPNVVKFYEHFEEESAIFLVTELCDGGDFSELNHGIDDPQEVKLLIRDVVKALAYCHDHGVAHRDLKFENCLIKESIRDCKVGKVIDFGLSAIRSRGEDEHTWLNDQLGTRFFVAPEVIDKSIPYGCKCDCWSLGVMLYIILTDEHPCSPDAHKLETAALFGKILTGRVRSRPLQEADVDHDAAELLYALLEKNPDARMDAQGALRSPWLANIQDSRPKLLHSPASSDSDLNVSQTTSPVSHGMIRRLATFRHYSKFERAVLTLVAHRSEDAHVAELRDAFHTLDVSQSGSLSKSEIKEGIHRCGHAVGDVELNEIFSALDADGTGKVHYTEWLAATMQPSALATDKAIKQVYHYLDIDQTGHIAPHELYRVLGCNDSVKSVLQLGDTNGDSLINEDEFRVLMRNLAKRLDQMDLHPKRLGFHLPEANSIQL